MSRMSRTRMSLLVSRNGLPYSPIADFTDITSYMNIFCTPVQCAIDSSFKFNNDTCHIWSAEHPPLQGSGTLGYATSYTIILYNSVMLPWLVFLTVKCPSRNPAYMWGATETESPYHGGELIPILHSGNGHKWKTSVQASSMIGYKAGSCQTG